MRLDGTREEYESSASLESVKGLAGLRWKIYGYDEEKSMVTGIYLFEYIESLNNYLAPFRNVVPPPGVSDMEFQVWDVQEKLSKVTKVPI